MDVAVIGAGAIGSTLGAFLSQSASVTVIGHRNQHFDRLETGSITVIDPHGQRRRRSVDATTDHEAVRDADLVIFAVKTYDTSQALADIEPAIGATPILTVQNGLGNIERIRRVIDPSQVIAGTTTMGAHVPEPGTVHLTSVGETRLGRPWGPADEFLEAIAEVFREANVPTRVQPAIRQAVWEKVLINVGINPVAALGEVPNGRLRSEPGYSLMASAIEEGNQVAAAEGFPVDEPVEKALAVLEATAKNRASMLRDIESGSRTEIGALNGAIVERAARHDIKVPINQTLTRAVRLKSDPKET